MKTACCCMTILRVLPVRATCCMTVLCTTGEGSVLLRVFCVSVFAGTTGEGSMLLRDCFSFSTGEGNAFVP